MTAERFTNSAPPFVRAKPTVIIRSHFAIISPFSCRPASACWKLGCGLGDLLAAVKPARGLGVDFSPEMLKLARQRHPELEFHVADAAEFSAGEKFDYILLSDLVNDLPDVQAVLERLQTVSTPDTRLVINFFNNLWRPILGLAEKTGRESRRRCCKTGCRPMTWPTCCTWRAGKSSRRTRAWSGRRARRWSRRC